MEGKKPGGMKESEDWVSEPIAKRKEAGSRLSEPRSEKRDRSQK